MAAPKEFSADKIYWKMGELAEELQEPQSAIRFWLTSFGVEVKREKNRNYRMFNADERAFIVEVKRLMREERYTIEGARKKLIANKFLKG